MKAMPREKLIVRESFLLPFRGGEIWALELDALFTHTTLAIEKFQRDIRFAHRPSTTSAVAVHLKDTCVNEVFAVTIVEGLVAGGQNIRKVAFVGVGREYRIPLSAALNKAATGFSFRFFSDYEKGKEWLLP